jgi:hypothetical protein
VMYGLSSFVSEKVITSCHIHIFLMFSCCLIISKDSLSLMLEISNFTSYFILASNTFSIIC